MSARGDKIVNIGRLFEASVFCNVIDRYKDQLHSILLNDERLGNADDIGIVLKGNTLICIQAKGSKKEKIWKLYELLSLLPGLYKSFMEIKNTFPELRVEIVYATSKLPTQSKTSLPKFEDEGISFLDFIRDYWEPFKQNKSEERKFLEPGICNEWFKKIQQKLDINDSALLDFLNHLELLYNIKFFEDRLTYEQKRMDKYYQWFLKAKITQIGAISSSSFFEQLGLFQVSLSHDFPVDEALYVNNQELFLQVAQLVESLDKGYIFLEGGPGMGKSTFLQMEINQQSLRTTRIFKYLCYRDDRHYSIKLRGDKEVFLTDLNSQFSTFLKKPLSEKNAQVVFYETLLSLSHFASENNLKILVVIDGIDHISRKQQVNHPFTRILPQPQQVPDQIVLLVVGQHFDDIDWFSNLPETGGLTTRLSMVPFDISRIKAYLDKKFDNDVSIDYAQKLMEKTKGNPLFLKILTESTENYTAFQENFDRILSGNPDFKNNLNELFTDYWNLYNFQDDNYIEAAGLIARIKGPIDINWLSHWPEARYIEEIMDRFCFLFIQIENLYLFEYETFSNFLFQESATVFNQFDLDRSKRFYRKLLNYSERYNATGLCDWYKVYYLMKCGRIEDILNIERLDFIQQFLNLRPIGDILADLSIMLEYAYNQKKYEFVFNLLLLKAEFEMRSYNFSEFLEYYLPLLIVFDFPRKNLSYLIATMLQSEGFQLSWKLSLSKEFLSPYSIRNPLKGLFKDFYSQYKAALSTTYIQDLEGLLLDWISVPILLGEDVKKIFQVFITIFPDLLEKRYNEHFALIPDFIYLVYKFGLILSNNNFFDEMTLIYDYLDKIIQEGGWQLSEENGELFYSNNKEKKLVQTHDVRFSIDPFQAKLRLKLRETHRGNINLIEVFLNENPVYRIIWEYNNEVFVKLRFYPDDITDDDLNLIFKEGASMRYYSRTKLLNRIWIYRQLKNHPRIRDNSSLLNLLNRSAQSRALPNLILQEDSYFFQWEVILRDFAHLYGQEIDESAFTATIGAILNLINVQPTRDVLGLYSNFQDVIFTFIHEIQEHFGSMGEEMFRQLIQMCEQGNNFFESIFVQLRIYEALKRAFSISNCDRHIMQIIDTHKDEIFTMAAPWTDKILLGDVILAMAALDRAQNGFIEGYRERIRELFDKVLFRIGARKDYQLFFMIHLLENLIGFFEPTDKEFTDCLTWIGNIINFTQANTEHNAIYYLKEKYIVLLRNWDPQIASAIENLITYQPYVDTYTPNIKPIEITKSQMLELVGFIKNPKEFLDQIQKILSEQKEIGVDYNIKGLFEKVFQLEENIESWINVLHYLTEDNPYPLETFHEMYGIIRGFLDFLKHLEDQGTELDSAVKIKIAQAELKSPGSSFSSQTSLRELFDLDQKVAFEWGWTNIGLIIREKDILWSIMTGSDWMILTFLAIINETNYRVFWEIYIKYLKELFDFIPFPIQ